MKIKEEYKCEFNHMCPALANCRKQGIFTRKNTDRCACKDLAKRIKFLNK